jgi:sulfite exporter TauE/SafE
MLIFGIGAAAPLVMLGSLSRTRMMKVRNRLLSAGKYGKQLLGLIMLVLGILIATGGDKSFEAWMLNQTPDWLTALTTKY